MSWYDHFNPNNWDIAPDYSLHGLHNWFVGGDASKGIGNMQNYDAATATLGQMANGSNAQEAPTAQASQLYGGQMDQSRGGMLGVAGNLGAIAGGQQAGAGELAVNRQVSQANAAQASAARQARGANAALAYRNAARNTADIGLGGAGAAAQAQMQDQQAANQQLGQIYGSMYGQDANVAAQNATLSQQAALANQSATLAQRGLNNQQQIAAMGQLLGWDQAKIDAEIKKAAVEESDKGILSNLFSGGGKALAASDERLKTGITDGGNDADELMSTLRPRTYSYKDESKWGEGPRLGIMAQDLARSKMGRATLDKVDDEGHLGFDLGKAASAALASVARLDERLRKIEGKAA